MKDKKCSFYEHRRDRIAGQIEYRLFGLELASPEWAWGTHSVEVSVGSPSTRKMSFVQSRPFMGSFWRKEVVHPCWVLMWSLGGKQAKPSVCFCRSMTKINTLWDWDLRNCIVLPLLKYGVAFSSWSQAVCPTLCETETWEIVLFCLFWNMEWLSQVEVKQCV